MDEPLLVTPLHGVAFGVLALPLVTFVQEDLALGNVASRPTADDSPEGEVGFGRCAAQTKDT